MSLEQQLEKLAKEMEIEGTFATQLPGVFEIPLDEQLSIYITNSPEGIMLTSTLDECPKENREDFFTHMLRADLYGEGTYGAVLGLNESNHFYLSKNIESNINYDLFRDQVEDFANSVDFWHEEAQSYLSRNKV